MNRQSIPSDSKEIWGILKETQKTLKAMSVSQKETNQQLNRLSTELSISHKQTDRHIQKIGGRFNQRWGALVESLVEGKLVQIFQDRGIDITQTHTRSRVEWRTPKGRVEKKEFDIIVANGTEVVVVEVKTVLTPKDVRYFLETLQNFRKYFPRYKTETVYGAAAYLSAENRADFLAETEGLFLIRATGDSASLVNRKDFQPKAFCPQKGKPR